MRDGPAYLRRARLTIVRPRPDPSTGAGSYFGTQRENALVIERLRIQFSIKKSLGKKPNAGELTITNLAEATRDQLAATPLVAILEVGYGDAELRRLFAGDVLSVTHDYDGTEWTTTLQAHDGGRALAHGRVRVGYRARTPALAVLREVARSLGLRLPRDTENLPALQQALTAGASLSGRASEELSRLLEPLGLGWSIQDGDLVVLPERGIRPGEAILIDEAAGMIGSPKWGSPPKPGQRPPLSVECLLFPELEPGREVQVKSRTANGQFKVTAVEHAGDTEGGDWKTAIEGYAQA